MNEWNRTEHPQIYSHLQGHVAPKRHQSNIMGKNAFDPDFIPYAKITDLNMKAKTIRTFKNKNRKNIFMNCK